MSHLMCVRVGKRTTRLLEADITIQHPCVLHSNVCTFLEPVSKSLRILQRTSTSAIHIETIGVYTILTVTFEDGNSLD